MEGHIVNAVIYDWQDKIYCKIKYAKVMLYDKIYKTKGGITACGKNQRHRIS